jgi:hypothetical protein
VSPHRSSSYSLQPTHGNEPRYLGTTKMAVYYHVIDYAPLKPGHPPSNLGIPEDLQPAKTLAECPAQLLEWERDLIKGHCEVESDHQMSLISANVYAECATKQHILPSELY